MAEPGKVEVPVSIKLHPADAARVTGKVFTTMVLTYLLNAYVLMLVIGGLHHEVSSSIPAASYFGTVLLMAAVNLLRAGRPTSN